MIYELFIYIFILLWGISDSNCKASIVCFLITWIIDIFVSSQLPLSDIIPIFIILSNYRHLKENETMIFSVIVLIKS